MSLYLTSEDVRTYLVDSSPEDNELLDDIDFTPGQIQLAMRMAAAAFNEIRPHVRVVQANTLPLSEWAMTAVQEQLYRMRLNQLERNAITLEAGNTGFDEDGTRIRNMNTALQRMSNWRQAAFTLKQSANVSDSYGCSF